MLSQRSFWMVKLVLLLGASVARTCIFAHDDSPRSSLDSQSSVSLEGINFQLPAGITIEKVAADPLVINPIVCDWDPEGRLVLVEAAGVKQSVEVQRVTRPNRLVRLIDDDGDGRFDRRIVAATDLSFPEGVLCIGNRVLVAAPPEIWCFTDNDGDGVCEQRDVWFDGTTLTYCANDLHGPYLGLDGWIYWCKGAFAEQEHALLGGGRMKSKAAHIFRRHLEGGPIEPVMTGGMDNPVEVAFSQVGERFFTSTFLQHPANGHRDGIGHAIYGSVFGKDHAVINGHPRTGSLMPIMTHLGPAAPSGLLRLKNHQLVSEQTQASDMDTFLVAAQFNLQKVSLHRLVPQGASYSTENCDLLVGDRIDFHPTDVIEDANGSILVIDTGGWYDLCCPSSGVDQRKATGGIYRLSSPHLSDIRIARGIDDLNCSNEYSEGASRRDKRLDLALDERWWVRQTAFEQLIADGDRSIAALDAIVRSESHPHAVRLDALWSLCRIGTDSALSAIDRLLEMRDPRILHASLNALSLHRRGTRDRLVGILQGSDPSTVRRAAAEALGQLPNEGSDQVVAEVLLGELSKAHDDRAYEHSLLYALIEQRPIGFLKGVLAEDMDSSRKIAALKVLSQTDSEGMSPKDVFRLSQSKSEDLRTIALAVLKEHREWSGQLDRELADLWNRAPHDPIGRKTFLNLCGEWGMRPELVKNLEASLLTSSDSEHQPFGSLVLESLTCMPTVSIPQSWTDALVQRLRVVSADEQLRFAEWLQNERQEAPVLREMSKLWLELANADQSRVRHQLGFLAALEEGFELSDRLAAKVIDSLTESDDETERRASAKVLSRVQLSDAQLVRLIEKLERIDARWFTDALTAVAKTNSLDVQQALIHKLNQLPAFATISKDQLQRCFKNRDSEFASLVEARHAERTKPPEDIERALDEWEHRLTEGDSQRGMQVFRSGRAACSACHTVGYVGGNIGPELTRIGSSRSRRDLLEAILFPSFRLAQSYQSNQILTRDGEVYVGLIAHETHDAVELILSADKRVRILLTDIETMRPSSTSVMPSGLEKVLSEQELSDLVTFLQSSR